MNRVATKKKIDYTTRYQQGTGSLVGTGQNPADGYLYGQSGVIAKVKSSIASVLVKLPPEVRDKVYVSFTKFFSEMGARYSRFLARMYQEFIPFKADILEARKTGGDTAAVQSILKILETNHSFFQGKIDSLAKDTVRKLWEARTKEIARAINTASKKAPPEAQQALNEATRTVVETSSSGFEQYYRTAYSVDTLMELIAFNKSGEGITTKFNLADFYHTIGVFKK